MSKSRNKNATKNLTEGTRQRVYDTLFNCRTLATYCLLNEDTKQLKNEIKHLIDDIEKAMAEL